jgi:Putative transposase
VLSLAQLSFLQFFGSALQFTPHFHALVPDDVFVAEEGKTGWGWSGCAAMGRAVRWHLSVCRERRTAASRTG